MSAADWQEAFVGRLRIGKGRMEIKMMGGCAAGFIYTPGKWMRLPP